MGAPSHDTDNGLPKAAIDRFVQPLTRFLHVEAASGVVLLTCTVIALVLANSPLGDSYAEFWKTKVGFSFGDFKFFHKLSHLVNDGLMAIFFFVVGLEVKRELVLGELRDLRRAALPIAAAIGGMLIPAVVYLLVVWDGPGQRGWGIPMATDIAFVVGCMAVLGKRVPNSLRITVLSLAIADDIGAILVIAVGYTEKLEMSWLILGFAGIMLVSFLARVGVRSITIYTMIGVFIWFAFHESGVHATIAGVILGLMTPARPYVKQGVFGRILGRASDLFNGGHFGDMPHRASHVMEFQRVTRETISPLEYLEAKLHPWTSFVVMPIFALANAGVVIQLSHITEPVALAIILGLVIGKPLGVLSFSWIAVRLKIARLPQGINWPIMLGAGSLSGIGFAMSLFIDGLALKDQPELMEIAKIGILVGSVIAATIGLSLLWWLLPKSAEGDS